MYCGQSIHVDFINRKQCYSINFQAVNNYRYCFIFLVEWPRCIQHARIFTTSSINDMLQEGIIPPWHRTIVDDWPQVSVFLLGDPVYQLLSYLGKECPAEVNKDVNEQFFSYRLFFEEW